MPHLNASARAAWLDQLANSTPGTSAGTLREIASWIRDRGDAQQGPPRGHAYQVMVEGPALWYFDRTGPAASSRSIAVWLDHDEPPTNPRALFLLRGLLTYVTDRVEQAIHLTT